MKIFLFINVKIPTIVGILTLMSGKNSILGLSEPKKAEFLDIFILMSISELCMKKNFITSGPGFGYSNKLYLQNSSKDMRYNKINYRINQRVRDTLT